jgi:hypothetical protein
VVKYTLVDAAGNVLHVRTGVNATYVFFVVIVAKPCRIKLHMNSGDVTWQMRRFAGTRTMVQQSDILWCFIIL